MPSPPVSRAVLQGGCCNGFSLPAGSSVPIFLPRLLSLRSAPSQQCGPRQCRHGDHLGWYGKQGGHARLQAPVSFFVLVMSTEWPLAMQSQVSVGVVKTRVADLGLFSKEQRHAVST